MTIDQRMIKARSALVMSQPFFGTLALCLTLEEDESVETMATDGKRLIYAPSFLDATDAREHIAVIAHEVYHCAFKHHTRRNKRDANRWNVACDYAINPLLIDAGFTLPKGVLMDRKFSGKSAEEIYALLEADSSQETGKGSGAAGGNGAPGGQSTPQTNSASVAPLKNGASGSNCGKVLDAAPDYDKAANEAVEAEWDRNVRQACAVAAAHNAGAVPGFLQELVKAINKPKVDWRDQLRRFIDDRSRVDYSWTRPNRRMMSAGHIFPGTVPENLRKLGVVLDTSGSINMGLLTQFKSELQAMLDENAVQEIVVIQCDTKVHRIQYFQAGDQIELVANGRGGTKFSPALQWFDTNEPDTAALIYFTDLMTDDWGVKPACPLLWAAYGYDSRLDTLAARVPFGEVIKVVS